MPLVTVDSSPNGEPIATTPWPTARSEDLPIVAGVRPLTFSAWITAVSVSGSVPSTLAFADVPSLKETEMEPELPAIATTWLLVRIWPSELRMMPEPDPASCGPATSILTTEGRTSLATCWTEPLAAGWLGVSTTCEVVRADEAVVESEPVVPHWSQAAAQATPAAPPTSSEAVTTEAAKADRPLRRVVVGPPGGVGRQGQLLEQPRQRVALLLGQLGHDLLLGPTAQVHGAAPDVGARPGDLDVHPAPVVGRGAPLDPPGLLQQVEAPGHPGAADLEVLGQRRGARLARRLADHQVVQGLVLEVLEPDLRQRLVRGALEVADQAVDAGDDGLHLVVEVDVDPVVPPASDVAVRPVVLVLRGHDPSLVSSSLTNNSLANYIAGVTDVLAPDTPRSGGPLRSRNFRLLVTGTTTSALGNAITP